MKEINEIQISLFKDDKNEKLPILNKEKIQINDKILIKKEKQNNNIKFLQIVNKFNETENKKIYVRQENKSKFCNFIIIFIISIISYFNCNQILTSQDSNVTLKFTGSGSHNVFYKEHNFTWPNEVYINNNKKDYVNYTYDLNEGDIVKLVWTTDIINCQYMFNDCESIKEIIFTNFNTSLCNYMSLMFKNCKSLISLDLSNFDTSNVRKMESMFSNCYSLTSLNIKNFNTMNVVNMGHMFNNCSSLASIDLSSFQTPKVNATDNMFNGCKNLTSINVSFFDSSNVTRIEKMFCNCISLKYIDIPNLIITSKMTKKENIFLNCDNLEFINLKYFETEVDIDNNFLIRTSKYLVICTNNEALINRLKSDACISFSCENNWYDYRPKINLENGLCTSNCTSTNFKYEIDYECYPKCLRGTYDYNYKCIEPNEQIPNMYDIMLNDIKKDFTSIYYNTSILDQGYNDIFEFRKLKVTLTTSKNQKEGINNGNETIIDLGKCETKLKEIYNISENEVLYIRKIDATEEGMKIPKVEYDIYSKLNGINLVKLNLTYCNNTKIDIYYPVKLEESLDKYNSKSKYYNDICYSSSSDSGADIILNDRKNEFINKNKTICQDDCFLSEYNYIFQQVKCSCDVKESSQYFSNMKINKAKLLNSFINVKNIININILVCYKTLFTKNGLLNNYGNYLTMTIIIMHFIIIILFYGNNFFKIIIEKIEHISNGIRSAKFLNIKEKKIIVFKDLKNIDKSKKNHKIQSKKFAPSKNKIINMPPKKMPKIINLNNSSNNNIFNSSNNKKINNINNSKINNKNTFISKYDLSKKNNNSILKTKKLKSFNDAELNGLSYEAALNYDKRNFCQYYFSLFKTKHDIIFSFCTSNDYNLKIIKIDLFFFNFIFSLEINALFFNDDTMHKIYEDEGSFNLLYQIPQILYSTLISNFISIFINMLALSEDNILAFKQIKEIKNLNKKKLNLNKKLKIKFLIYFIFSSLFLLFFWYYISMFCAIYVNTQIHLIKDTLLSFILSLIYPIFLYFIPSIFRMIALSNPKNKRVYFYKVSQFIENII